MQETRAAPRGSGSSDCFSPFSKGTERPIDLRRRQPTFPSPEASRWRLGGAWPCRPGRRGQGGGRWPCPVHILSALLSGEWGGPLQEGRHSPPPHTRCRPTPRRGPAYAALPRGRLNGACWRLARDCALARWRRSSCNEMGERGISQAVKFASPPAYFPPTDAGPWAAPIPPGVLSAPIAARDVTTLGFTIGGVLPRGRPKCRNGAAANRRGNTAPFGSRILGRSGLCSTPAPRTRSPP